MTAKRMALVVVPGPAEQRFLRKLFVGHGFRVTMVSSAHRGRTEARRCRPDIVIADEHLPDGDAVELIAPIRSWSSVPIVVLSSAEAEVPRRLRALRSGADEYVATPFLAGELMNRVRTILDGYARGPLSAPNLRMGRVSIDLARRSACYEDGRELDISILEYRMLERLVRSIDQPLTTECLLREVWGPDRRDRNVVLTYFSKLRRKLEENPARPKYLLREPGVGLRLAMSGALPDRRHWPRNLAPRLRGR